MVSPLWKASSEGELEKVHGFLKDASPQDIEIKDHDGVTPLIEAVKNGHVDIVRALLDGGADAANASSYGPPEVYTQSPVILELLSAARNKHIPNGAPASDQPYHDPAVEPSKHGYYPPPPGAYAYYPGMPPPPVPEGAVPYYPSIAPPGAEQLYGNLPPPEVARMIPCRFYPACRYGSSCLFAHPQGTYYQGAPPPVPYPAPYDPMAPHMFGPGYYAAPPPSFPPSQNVTSPASPPAQLQSPPPMLHQRSGSDIMPSSTQGHMSPNGPPPLAYAPPNPMPNYVAHPSGPPPMQAPPLSPQHYPPPAQAVPQSPPFAAPHPGSAMPPFVVQSPPNGHIVSGMPADGPQSPPLLPQPNDRMPMGRDGPAHARRGSIRRQSIGRGKPPCMFFPSGRCRNGDDCRFPHVLTDSPPIAYQGVRGGHRPRYSSHTNGFGTIEEKFADMSIHENGALMNGHAEGAHRPGPGTGRGHNAFRGYGPPPAQPRMDKRPPATKQRVPGADEFPSLGGSTPSPSRSPGMGNFPGLPERTAAQVLSAPAPPRKDNFREAPSSNASEAPSSKESHEAAPEAVEVNGNHSEVAVDVPTARTPVSFAAAAHGSIPAGPEVTKAVSVSA